MSSYELLELLEFMDERGAFKTAARGGEFSHEEKVWVQIANEIAVLRAGYMPKVKGEEYGAQMFYSPLALREMVEKADAQTEVREGFYAFATGRRGAQSAPPDEGDDFDDAEGVA